MKGLRSLFPSQNCFPVGRNDRARIIAHLINSSSSWSSLLESSLSSFLPLSITVFLRALHAINSPAKALRFFTHVHEKPNFPHFSYPYFLMLEILGRSRSLNPARAFLLSIEKRSNGSIKLEEKFFNSLIRSYGKAGLSHESLKLFSLMKSMTISPSAITFNSLMHVLVKNNRFLNAQKVFDEMLRTYGVAPDAYSFNIMIKGLCKNNEVSRAFELFNEMHRFDCEPGVVTYNTIVDGLCREGKAEIAHNVVKGMIKKSRSNPNISPNALTYTPLINGYCSVGKINEALSLFDEMSARGVSPNEVSFNSLLNGVCASKNLGMLGTLEKAIDVGSFTPDTCTFNILINTRCQEGNLEEALGIFEKMKRMKIFPDSATYSVLIRALCGKEDYRRAEELLDDLLERRILLREDGCVPYGGAYSAVLEFLCRSGKSGKSERLLRQLMRRSKMVSQCFDIVIRGHCREGAYVAAYDLLQAMSARRLEGELGTYEVLVNGLVKKKEAELAVKALERMRRSGHVAKAGTFWGVLEAQVRGKRVNDVARVMEMMLGGEIPLNVKLSTASVKMLFGCGIHEKGFKVVYGVYERGYRVLMREVVGFLIGRGMTWNAYKMTVLCFKYDEAVELGQCDVVISGLCGRGMVSEAFEVFYEMVERKLHCHLTCGSYLEGVLQREGRFEEAHFVSKRICSF